MLKFDAAHDFCRKTQNAAACRSSIYEVTFTVKKDTVLPKDDSCNTSLQAGRQDTILWV